MRGGAILLAAALAAPMPVLAQPLPDAAEMEAIEARIPPQSWYPDGYYDLRIAAEAQVAEFPRPAERLSRYLDAYDVLDCDAEKVGLDAAADPVLQRYGNIALETARLRLELERLGYPTAVYADPLAAFEKARIEDADADAVSTVNRYPLLAAAIEANRLRLAPEMDKVVALDTCRRAVAAAAPAKPATLRKPIVRRAATRGAKPAAASKPPAGPGVTLATLPAAGEVLLINAFAFKVCMRKQADPWDRFACKWNEIETGIAKPLSGRFVYQVRWPDGTVRKGTREVTPGASGAATVTFRKTGS